MFEAYCKMSPSDGPIFRELGLKPFSNIGQYKKYFVGKVVVDKSWVNIWVEAAPALFWEFEIFCEDTGKVTKFATGSGVLSDYWPTVTKIMDGMIVIE